MLRRLTTGVRFESKKRITAARHAAAPARPIRGADANGKSSPPARQPVQSCFSGAMTVFSAVCGQ
jgi:hypothetical protein